MLLARRGEYRGRVRGVAAGELERGRVPNLRGAYRGACPCMSSVDDTVSPVAVRVVIAIVESSLAVVTAPFEIFAVTTASAAKTVAVTVPVQIGIVGDCDKLSPEITHRTDKVLTLSSPVINLYRRS